jgi:hypothetical protein
MVRVPPEISGKFPAGVSKQVQRAVSKRAELLQLKVSEWEQ